MKTIEFTTQAEDGIIRIPKKYAETLTNKLRVVIFLEESDKARKKKVANKKTSNSKTSTKKQNKVVTKNKYPRKVKFTALSITTKDFKFNRDEANER